MPKIIIFIPINALNFDVRKIKVISHHHFWPKMKKKIVDPPPSDVVEKLTLTPSKSSLHTHTKITSIDKI